jgi:hypothetical protein
VRASDFSTKPTTSFDRVEPVLQEFCYDCHGEGEKKGKVSLDEFKSHEELLGKRDLWLAVLKNVRAGLMPPEKKPRPSEEQKKALEEWIKRDVFGTDFNDPDPGRVTIRRLNRVEYRNTMRDLMGWDFSVEEELPPDDTGYGFDNIGDVLTVSPMLLEKYMHVAETIVAGAVPRVPWVAERQDLPLPAMMASAGYKGKDRLSFYNEVKMSHPWTVKHTGTYRVVVETTVHGEFDYDPGRCMVVVKVDDQEVWHQEFEWRDSIKQRYEFPQSWTAGEHKIGVELVPLVPIEEKLKNLDLRLVTIQIHGPNEQEHWVRPRNFDLFFTHDPPATPAERESYAREILTRFATKAFRRPIKPEFLERLVELSQTTALHPGKSFEDGIAQAMLPVLSSPRFLFRVEEPLPNQGGHPLVDEYALASRLSYFLWSTMPDDELFSLAQRGELRKNLRAQVDRLLASPRSNALVENFVGQWLQVRDIAGSISMPVPCSHVTRARSGKRGEHGRASKNFVTRRNSLPRRKKSARRSSRTSNAAAEVATARPLNWTATCAAPSGKRPRWPSVISFARTAASSS